MPSGADLVAQARRLTGYHYRFGGELDPLGPPGDCDCSELVEWAVAQAGRADGTGIRITDGSWLQYQACQHIPLAEALTTTGALVFLSKTDPPQEGRDGVYHVGVVDAQAQEVVEACCSDGDRIQPTPFGARNWYHTAGLIPGIDYFGDTMPSAEEVAWAVWSLQQTPDDYSTISYLKGIDAMCKDLLARIDALEAGSGTGTHSHEVGPPITKL